MLGALWRWLRADGLLHIETTALLFLLFVKLSFAAAIVLCLVVGIMKELHDRYSGEGAAEWHDVICDVVGIVVGVAIWFVPVLQ